MKILTILNKVIKKVKSSLEPTEPYIRSHFYLAFTGSMLLTLSLGLAIVALGAFGAVVGTVFELVNLAKSGRAIAQIGVLFGSIPFILLVGSRPFVLGGTVPMKRR